jgi:predicted alpha/beta hydrolase
MTAERDLELEASDGTKLRATCFEPADTPSAQLLIAGAMGVPRRFYRHFARHCAKHGIRCLTLDYRGIGKSGTDGSWHRKADILDWATRDLPAAHKALHNMAPGLPLSYLGHSLGGQILGLVPCAGSFSHAILVATGFGYWKLFPKRAWPRMWLAWYLLVPTSLALLGRVPSWVLGGEPIPGKAARRWRQWCLNPDYVVDDEGRPLRPFYHEVRKVHLVNISDDHDLAPLPATRALADIYPETRREILVQRPEDYGLRRIGHFGCFRPETGSRLWTEWLSLVPRGSDAET